MILFEHDGKKYKLLFRYGVDNRGRRTTTAFVCYQGKNQPVLWEATSTCSLEDNFCKESGRKVALKFLIREILELPFNTKDHIVFFRFMKEKPKKKELCKAMNIAYYNREKK